MVAVVATGVYVLSSRYVVSRPNGTGGVSAPQDTMQRYSSEDGYSFMYPTTYELSSRTEGTAERQWDVLVLLPKGYTPPQNGEGPATISVGVFPNPEGLSLEQWVRGDNRSNFKLSADQKLKPVTLAGQSAVHYTYDGLYRSDAVAAAHDGKIVVFTSQWMGESDETRDNFTLLLNTVEFN